MADWQTVIRHYLASLLWFLCTISWRNSAGIIFVSTLGVHWTVVGYDELLIYPSNVMI